MYNEVALVNIYGAGHEGENEQSCPEFRNARGS